MLYRSDAVPTGLSCRQCRISLAFWDSYWISKSSEGRWRCLFSYSFLLPVAVLEPPNVSGLDKYTAVPGSIPGSYQLSYPAANVIVTHLVAMLILITKKKLNMYINIFLKSVIFTFGHITKTGLFKYTEYFTKKKWKFSDKNSDIFHISAQNIDCVYSLEPPRRGGYNEYPQSMFLSRNKKNNVYPCKPQFYYI